MTVPTPGIVKRFAREDFNKIAEAASAELSIDLSVDDIEFQTNEATDEEVAAGGDYQSAFYTYATATFVDAEGSEYGAGLEYFVGDDDVFVSDTVEEATKSLVDYLKNPEDITAATDVDGDEVVAAEDGFDDQLDAMADNIEDLQDSVDDAVEDDESEIEVENNITDHYIAECDRCHGVFISAMIESDQDVQSISGVCPLCGKESEQVLKWIIRDAVADNVDDTEEVELAEEYQEDAVEVPEAADLGEINK